MSVVSKIVGYVKKIKPCCQDEQAQKADSSKIRRFFSLLLKLGMCCSIPVVTYLLAYTIFSSLGYAIPAVIIYVIILFCPVTHLIVIFGHIYKRKQSKLACCKESNQSD